ncbi:hypothetical protein [Nocardioides massiliensis]|uniref:Uncharacterized protein n=1 Tax=Nocardioides massiliensis TaxID=1325935 RepID=A0ABT9NQS1_9ACTN|nr:hypothetical protein [Nocardioides massiliensis]MDP9822775.1 hypothetical protein [Nocardioides massiliensis]
MSRRRITIELDRPLMIVRGWRAGDLAREAGLRPIWSGVSSGWMLDASRLPDLSAYLESRNIPVVIDDPAQGDLFGGEGG